MNDGSMCWRASRRKPDVKLRRLPRRAYAATLAMPVVCKVRSINQ